LKPIGHLTIRHNVDVPVFRKELFKSAQAKSQLIIVPIPPFNISKLGKIELACGF
jgi:hypothetical protein